MGSDHFKPIRLYSQILGCELHTNEGNRVLYGHTLNPIWLRVMAAKGVQVCEIILSEG